jgi:dTDP-4-amino-4,6-dideoxygalactose transaminase
MGGQEKKYVEEAFDTNWVAPLGPNVNAFEQQLCDQLNVKGAVSLSSGTAALHLALEGLQISQGDVVICQSFTFAASAFPINYCKATPVFVDSEEDTWNMDPTLLQQAITDTKAQGKKIAAIIVVHLYGMPAKMNEIMEIASHHQIPVIEDAAEALGSYYHEQPCGGIGKVGILSFNGNKIITTSGGGALASNDEALVQFTRHVSAQAKEPAPYYLHKQIGYNYRMSNICAGIGRGQMEVLSDRVARRRAIHDRYCEALAYMPGIQFLQEPEGSFSNRWLTTILFDTQYFPEGTNEQVRLGLEQYDMDSRQLWKPLHQQPVFENCTAYLNGVSDRLFAMGLCLPSGSNMSDEVQDQVIDVFKNCLAGLTEKSTSQQH